MTRDELMIAVLQRRNRRKMWNSNQLADPLGITAKGLVEKIRKLKLNKEFLEKNLFGKGILEYFNLQIL